MDHPYVNSQFNMFAQVPVEIEDSEMRIGESMDEMEQASLQKSTLKRKNTKRIGKRKQKTVLKPPEICLGPVNQPNYP